MRLLSKRLAPLLVCGLVLTGYAQEPKLTAPAPVPAAKKAIFWKVSSPTSVTYLLGSIHLGSRDMYPLPGEIEDAFASSSVLLVEADIRHVDMARMQAAIFAKGMYPEGDSLWSHISSDTRGKLEQFCERYQFPTEFLARLKPWVVSLTISTVPLIKAGFDPNLGIDMYFLNKAGDKRIVEIESADWQIDLLSGFAPDLQEKLLAASAEEGLDMQASLKRMQEAWAAGDTGKLEAITKESTRTPEAITRALLQDRNPHMADAAETCLKGKEQAFLVVGAAHMVGKEGVPALLEKRGYKVEQVTLKK
ncbi:MAG: TraB/GumN family protein [Acidobacteria bacterium]|nr:TraB/GumN family protein [Acidobacteriota bacterium]